MHAKRHQRVRTKMLLHAATVPPPLSPIIVVPGLGGSVLEAKLDGAPPFRDCETSSDWFTLWASLTQGLTRYACFDRNMELVLDNTTGLVRNATGVSMRPRDFGGTGGIEYSNAGAGGEPHIAYMHALVSALENVGYVAGVSLRAATSDFRGVGLPQILAEQYARLRQLIEDTVALNGGRQVHLLSHSLGGPYTTLFLAEAEAAWKSRYVRSFISLSAPIMGTAVALEGVISGPMYDWIPQFLPELLVPSIRTFPSIAWMFPRAHEDANVWGENFTFVSTPSHNYSLGGLRSLVDALNATVISHSWDAVEQRTARSASDPGVPVLCVYANDTRTDLSIRVPDDTFASKGVRTSSTMGDGTVNLPSLEACSRWAQVAVRPVRFGGSLAAHTEIARSPEVIKMIIDWATATEATTELVETGQRK